MSKNAEKNIQEVSLQVLKENNSLLNDTNKELSVLFDEAMQKYGVTFFKGIKKKAPKMTYGLQLGASKRFCDFSLKCFINLNLPVTKEKINEFFETVTPPAINMTGSLENTGMAVYGIIKELKISIDNTAAEKFL